MPDIAIIIIAAIFLPLFPMSMVFNWLFDRCSSTILRILLLVLWPLIGVSIILKLNIQLPVWLLWASVLTSALYAFRILTLREVNQWSGFMATSLWSLLWIPLLHATQPTLIGYYVIAMTLPLILLVTLSAGLERRFGAAYTGLYGGLARSMPRFAGVLVVVIISATATPLFPSFFVMLHLIVDSIRFTTVTLGLLLIWLLWSWAGARLIQGLIVGRASEIKIADFSKFVSMIYAIVLIGMTVLGIYLAGVKL